MVGDKIKLLCVYFHELCLFRAAVTLSEARLIAPVQASTHHFRSPSQCGDRSQNMGIVRSGSESPMVPKTTYIFQSGLGTGVQVGSEHLHEESTQNGHPSYQMKTIFWAEQKEGLRITFFTRVAKSTLSSNKNTGYPIFLHKYVQNS